MRLRWHLPRFDPPVTAAEHGQSLRRSSQDEQIVLMTDVKLLSTIKR
jgi:hypothetical protein